jgi:hypothetical protein
MFIKLARLPVQEGIKTRTIATGRFIIAMEDSIQVQTGEIGEALH